MPHSSDSRISFRVLISVDSMRHYSAVDANR